MGEFPHFSIFFKALAISPPFLTWAMVMWACHGTATAILKATEAIEEVVPKAQDLGAVENDE